VAGVKTGEETIFKCGVQNAECGVRKHSAKRRAQSVKEETLCPMRHVLCRRKPPQRPQRVDLFMTLAAQQMRNEANAVMFCARVAPNGLKRGTSCQADRRNAGWFMKPFQSLRSRPKARRGPMKKRSIQVVCEHFKEVLNTAIGC
jgi:hypothetical protein